MIYLRGLGYDYYDVLRATGIEDCDPRDSACVARNQQRDNAAVDYWLTVMGNPDTASQPTPKITVGLDTSQYALNQFMNNQPLTSETISVGNQAPVSVATLETQTRPPAPVKAAAPAGISPTPVAGGNSGPVLTSVLQTAPGGFSVSDVPWWGWLAGGAVALFALRGK